MRELQTFRAIRYMQLIFRPEISAFFVYGLTPKSRRLRSQCCSKNETRVKCFWK